jgi:hypothetical protein
LRCSLDGFGGIFTGDMRLDHGDLGLVQFSELGEDVGGWVPSFQ